MLVGTESEGEGWHFLVHFPYAQDVDDILTEILGHVWIIFGLDFDVGGVCLQLTDSSALHDFLHFLPVFPVHSQGLAK